jgi:hypothetical protein
VGFRRAQADYLGINQGVEKMKPLGRAIKLSISRSVNLIRRTYRIPRNQDPEEYDSSGLPRQSVSLGSALMAVPA